MPTFLLFAAGIISCGLLPSLPGLYWFVPVVCVPVALMLFRRGPAYVRWPLAFLVGLSYAVFRAGWRLADELDPALIGKTVELVVVVREVSPFSGGIVEVGVESAGSERVIPPRLALSDFKRRDWPAGSRWRLPVRLRGRHAPANQFGLDGEQYAWANGVLGRGTAGKSRERLEDANEPSAWLAKLRESLARRTVAVLGTTREAALITALTVGVTRGISREDRERFARTGLSHLIAISGLHIGLMAGLVAAVVKRMLAWRVPKRWAPRRIVAWSAVAGAGAYALLAGFGVPARRAFFMVLTVAVLMSLRRSMGGPFILAFTLCVVLVLDPFAIHAPGLWLSFAMVAALMSVTTGRRRAVGGWRGMVSAQWATSWMSVIPVPVFFGSLPLVSPLANLLAIPFVSIVLVPLALLAVLLPWDGLLQLCGWVAQGFLMAVEGLDGAPVLTLAMPPWPFTLVAMLGVFWVLLPRGVPGKWLALLLIWPFVSYRPPVLPDGVFRLTVLDVGQGLAVLVETARHSILYDTGALAAGRVILPGLAGRGISRLDRLVLSHHDKDHDGAAPEIVARVPATEVWAGQADTWLLPPAAIQCRPGLQWQHDGVEFEVLSPAESVRSRGKNDFSCVVQIRGRFQSALLTGDITARLEESLVAQYGAALGSTMMTSPHHGSKTSSSPRFLAAVQPTWVVVSAGHANQYGHPHAVVMARYREYGITVLRTDQSGAVTLTADKTVGVERLRQDIPRYWRSHSETKASTRLPLP